MPDAIEDKPEVAGRRPRVEVGTIIAVVALLLSLASTYLQFFWESHDLRGSLVKAGERDGKLLGDVLLINRGNKTEVVMSVRFTFSTDLDAAGRALGRETFGPLVLKPGDALLQHISADLSELIDAVEAMGSADPCNGKVHVGAEFEVIDPSGNIRSSVYKFARIEFRDCGPAGSTPGKEDDTKPIRLLTGGGVDD